MANRYLVKLAETAGKVKVGRKSFNAPDTGSAHPGIPGMRNMQWDGKKTIDPNVKPGSATREARLNKAKSLLTKKKITIGIKTGLGVGAALGAYHLGKSILNNLEP